MDHVAIDLGGRESQICVRKPSNEIVSEKRVSTFKLKHFFAAIPPSRIVLETCAEAFGVACQAKDAGHDVRIVPATLVRTLGVGHRGIKTDQRDARCLSEASVRVDLGSVHIPSRLARDMKMTCGMRAATVRARTLLINNVSGWARGELLSVPTGAAHTFTERVWEYCGEKKVEVPTCVARQLTAIDGLTKQVDAASRELRELSEMSDDCQRLMTMPGVGPVTAIRFLAAIDEVGRFATAHALESYFGLTPGEHSSSDSKHRTGITKAGSPVVRHLMTEAAWTAIRTRRADPMVVWALAKAEHKPKQVAVIALARKMVGIMFAMLRDGTTYKPQLGSIDRAKKTAPVAVTTAKKVLQEARRQ